MFYSILEDDDCLQTEEYPDGGVVVSVPFAESHDGRVSFIETIFAPFEVDGTLFQEIFFQIKVISLDGSHENFVTQSSEIARPYVPDDIRSEVLGIVLKSCELLLKVVGCRNVYFVTKDRNLPEKALRKYYLLLEIILSAGFSISQVGTDPVGRAFWKLCRTNN